MPDINELIIKPDLSVIERIENEDSIAKRGDIPSESKVDKTNLKGMDRFKIATYFGIDMVDSNSMDKVSYITNTLTKMGVTDNSDQLYFISQMENKMKSVPLDSNRLRHFLTYFKIYLQSHKIFSELKAYER